MQILSLDGGGYLGLATAAFIEEIERHFNTSCTEHFDLFCGTSTGAIIALGLATGMPGRDIVALYQQFGAKVFRNPLPGMRRLRTVRGLMFARYSNRCLAAALADAFGDLTLGDLRARNKSVLITAFSVTNGRPRVFKTDHSPDLSTDNQYLLRDIALASAAAPVYLPMVTLKSPTTGVEERYCDGGVFANQPALLGYAEAVSHLGVPSEDVRILSVSTPRADLAERSSVRSPFQQFLLSRGLMPWGSRLANVMIDAPSRIAHETLRRLLDWPPGSRQQYVRIELAKPGGVELDIATKQATETLRQLGFDRACDNATRACIKPFFQI